MNTVTNEPVSYQGVKLRYVLRLLLNDHDMTYVIRNEVLLLTTEDLAKEYSGNIRGMYPTSDLTVDPEPETAKVVPEQHMVTHHHDYSEIMELIDKVVAPESWESSGEMMVYYPYVCGHWRQEATETPAPRKYRTKKRCRLFRR